MTWWQVLLGLVGTVVVAVGGYITARSGNRSSPYAALAARVVQLEASDAEKSGMIAQLQAQIAGFRPVIDHIIVVHDWIDNGMAPPPPSRPAWAVRQPIPEFWPTPTSIIQPPHRQE